MEETDQTNDFMMIARQHTEEAALENVVIAVLGLEEIEPEEAVVDRFVVTHIGPSKRVSKRSVEYLEVTVSPPLSPPLSPRLKRLELLELVDGQELEK